MHLNVNIEIPFLWGNKIFKKGEWSNINFLIGPNGTGKSIFAEKLKSICIQAGLKVRYLNAERLSGFEKQCKY